MHPILLQQDAVELIWMRTWPTQWLVVAIRWTSYPCQTSSLPICRTRRSSQLLPDALTNYLSNNATWGPLLSLHFASIINTNLSEIWRTRALISYQHMDAQVFHPSKIYNLTNQVWKRCRNSLHAPCVEVLPFVYRSSEGERKMINIGQWGVII